MTLYAPDYNRHLFVSFILTGWPKLVLHISLYTQYTIHSSYGLVHLSHPQWSMWFSHYTWTHNLPRKVIALTTFRKVPWLLGPIMHNNWKLAEGLTYISLSPWTYWATFGLYYKQHCITRTSYICRYIHWA